MSFKHNALFTLALFVVLAVVGAFASLVFQGRVEPLATPAAPPPAQPARVLDAVVFAPPAPQDAPEDIREAVMLGYNILMDTRKYVGDHVGNKLECRNCHFEAGRAKDTLSLVGVAAIYPKYRDRRKFATELIERTNECFERSMNGKRLLPSSREMDAIITYYQWISKGIPVYAKVPWLGIKPIKSEHKPDAEAGHKVFAAKCAVCHGQEGLGSDIAPPLWGPDSFNDGAGMSKLKNFAPFSLYYMPKSAPSLTPEEALDVGQYAVTQPRPHFVAQH